MNVYYICVQWEVPMLGEPELASLKVGDVIQLQRRGFFRVDVAPSAASPHSGRRAPLVLFHVPDGHTKQMPGQVCGSGLKMCLFFYLKPIPALRNLSLCRGGTMKFIVTF